MTDRRCPGRSFAIGTLLTVAATVVSLAGAGAAVASPGEGPVRGAGEPGAVNDRYIVVLKDSQVTSSSVRQTASNLTRQYGGAVRDSFTSTVRGFSAKMTERQAKRLAANPAVSWVEHDKVVSVRTSQAGPPWGLDRSDQRNRPLNATYTYTTTAANVHAYVIDTGILTAHTQFGGRASVGADFVGDGRNGQDCQGHGTHVAGTIGGSTYGMAKGVKLVAVRVLNCDGSGYWSQVIGGIDWVTAHAVKPAVANMSLGGGASDSVDAAVRRSIAAGITYAVAAGNSNANACLYSPARTAEAITVGATDSADLRASFSNWGGCVDIFAPGVSVLSAYKDSTTATAWMSGTSMASPHVAGAAALVLAAHPAYTPAQVRNSLVAVGTPNVVQGAGTGSPNLLLYTGTASVPKPIPACVSLTNATPVAIPDHSVATSPVTVATCSGYGSSAGTVLVKITHSYRGDLGISLVAPDGTGYPLKYPDLSDGAADVRVKYVVNLSSEARKGTWRLVVRDYYWGDAGRIDGWTLTV